MKGMVVPFLDVPVFGAPDVDVTVRGDPVTQGSNRFLGNGRVCPDSDELYPWRESVAWVLRVAWGSRPQVDSGLSVVVRLTFKLQKPKSTGLWRLLPHTREDVDKLTRAALDAIATTSDNHPGAGIICNDSRVVCTPSLKLYAQPGETPGVRIELWTIPPEVERAGWVPYPTLEYRRRTNL